MGQAALLPCQIPQHPDLSEHEKDAPRRLSSKEFFRLVRNIGLVEAIARHGGLLQVLDVFPQEQAEQALEALEGLPQADWHESKTTYSYDAQHRFYRYDGNSILDIKKRIFDLAPEYFPNFHGAKYECGGLIQKHDDSHRFQVAPCDPNRNQTYPAGAVLFRKIAIIYYLTRNWKEEYGGCLGDLVDEEEPKVIVPKFNSLVTFLVPRHHEVTPMLEGSPPRYTIFGWFSDKQPYLPGLTAHPALLQAESDDETTAGSEGIDTSDGDDKD